MSKIDPRFVHGRGKHLFSIDFGSYNMGWGRVLHVRADNHHAAMAYARSYDITRLFRGDSFARFCKENGGSPEIIRVYDKTNKVVWEVRY